MRGGADWYSRRLKSEFPCASSPIQQWIPTTFQVVETGWPKEMTSSRRRSKGKTGTQASPSKARDPTQRPTLYEDDEEDEEDDAMDVDDIEQNPFTQVSKSQKPPTPMQIDEEEAEDDENLADDLDAEAVHAIGTQSAKKWRESESLVEAEMQGFREMMDVTPSKPGSRASQGPPDPDLGEQEEMQEDDFVGHLTQMQSRRKTAANTIDSPATASRRMDRMQDLSPEPSPTKNGSTNPYYLDSYPSTPSSVRSRSVTPRKNLFARGRVASPATPPRPFAMGPRRSTGVSLSARDAFESPEKVVMTPSKLRFVSTGQALTLGDEDEEDVFVTSTARDKLLAAVRSAETDAATEVEKNMMRSTQNMKVRMGDDDEEVAPLAQTRFASDSPPPRLLPIPSPLSPMLTPTASPRKIPSTSILKRRRPEEDPIDNTGISQLEPTFVATQAKRARFAPDPEEEEEIEAELEPTLVSQTRTMATLTSSTSSKRAPDTTSTDSGVDIRTSQGSGSTSDTQGSIGDEPEPNVFRYAVPAPSSKYVESTIRSFGEQDIVYQKPFFSLRQDLPSTKSTYGTRTFQLKTNGLENAPEFQFERAGEARLRSRSRGRPDLSHVRTWQFTARPPSRKDTARWLETEAEALQSGKREPLERPEDPVLIVHLLDAKRDTRYKLASQVSSAAENLLQRADLSYIESAWRADPVEVPLQ